MRRHVKQMDFCCDHSFKEWGKDSMIFTTHFGMSERLKRSIFVRTMLMVKF
jgi:hypothetical protein